MIETLVAAPVKLHGEGLCLILDAVDDIRVVGTATSAPDTLELASRLAPDILLLDLTMAEALEVVGTLGSRAGPRVVALTVPDGEDPALACLESGVSTYVTRDGSGGDLVQAIRDAHAGELRCSPRMAARLARRINVLSHATPADPRFDTLTTREADVLVLINDGLCNKEIAARLHIGLTTVKNHVHNVLGKLGVGNRNEAAALARRVHWRRMLATAP